MLERRPLLARLPDAQIAPRDPSAGEVEDVELSPGRPVEHEADAGRSAERVRERAEQRELRRWAIPDARDQGRRIEVSPGRAAQTLGLHEPPGSCPVAEGERREGITVQ